MAWSKRPAQAPRRPGARCVGQDGIQQLDAACDDHAVNLGTQSVEGPAGRLVAVAGVTRVRRVVARDRDLGHPAVTIVFIRDSEGRIVHLLHDGVDASGDIEVKGVVRVRIHPGLPAAVGAVAERIGREIRSRACEQPPQAVVRHRDQIPAARPDGSQVASSIVFQGIGLSTVSEVVPRDQLAQGSRGELVHLSLGINHVFESEARRMILPLRRLAERIPLGDDLIEQAVGHAPRPRVRPRRRIGAAGVVVVHVGHGSARANGLLYVPPRQVIEEARRVIQAVNEQRVPATRIGVVGHEHSGAHGRGVRAGVSHGDSLEAARRTAVRAGVVIVVHPGHGAADRYEVITGVVGVADDCARCEVFDRREQVPQISVARLMPIRLGHEGRAGSIVPSKGCGAVDGTGDSRCRPERVQRVLRRRVQRVGGRRPDRVRPHQGLGASARGARDGRLPDHTFRRSKRRGRTHGRPVE